MVTLLQPWPKYMRQTLVLVWDSALWEKFNSNFLNSFLLALKKFSFWEEDWALGYNSMKTWHLLNSFYFPKILSLKLFGNWWGNSYISCLLLIIMIRFTCGERKIWQNIKKSQNIMTKIVVEPCRKKRKVPFWLWKN